MLRDRVCLIGGEIERAIRTPAWFLRTNAAAKLFAKPDDRWEVNNVADRCDDIVTDLRKALQQYEEAVDQGELQGLSPLADVLLHGLE